MADVRDIVSGGEGKKASTPTLEGLLRLREGRDAAALVAEKDRMGAARPKGMHRELYNLVGGRAPVMPASGYTQSKAKLGAKTPAKKWLWSPFTNPARKDNLQLKHWVRADNAAAPYAFAKFNKQVVLPHVSKEEYSKYLRTSEWTEQETRQLLALCKQYDMRFVVVHDRYVKAYPATRRTMEDLKARYYHVVGELARSRASASDADLIYKYDKVHEERRRRQLSNVQARTWAQVREEARLREQLKDIEQRRSQQGRTVAIPPSLLEQTRERRSKSHRKRSSADSSGSGSGSSAASAAARAAAKAASKQAAAEARARAAALQIKQKNEDAAKVKALLEANAAARRKLQLESQKKQDEKEKGEKKKEKQSTPEEEARARGEKPRATTYLRSALMAQEKAKINPKIGAYVDKICEDLRIARPLPIEKVATKHAEVRQQLVAVAEVAAEVAQRSHDLATAREKRVQLLRKHGITALPANAMQGPATKRTISASLMPSAEALAPKKSKMP